MVNWEYGTFGTVCTTLKLDGFVAILFLTPNPLKKGAITGWKINQAAA